MLHGKGFEGMFRDLDGEIVQSSWIWATLLLHKCNYNLEHMGCLTSLVCVIQEFPQNQRPKAMKPNFVETAIHMLWIAGYVWNLHVFFLNPPM